MGGFFFIRYSNINSDPNNLYIFKVSIYYNNESDPVILPARVIMKWKSEKSRLPADRRS
jgi:hypothetical protein